MSLENLIRQRRTIQQFTAEKVSDEIVKQALDLSLWAPNHKLTFPWHWTLIGSSGREKLADLAVELKEKKSSEPAGEAKIKAIRESVVTPSHLILLSVQRSGDEERLWEDYATMACSVQIASLYLWEKGVGSKWSTSGFTKNAKTYELFSIDPSREKLVGALLIGKYTRVPLTASRPPIEKFLRSHD